MLLYTDVPVRTVEPIGTITRDLPFLDDTTRRMIESAMSTATNYWDFTNLLAENVAAPDCPPILVLLSYVHAKRLENNAVIDAIEEIHSDLPLVRPYFLSPEEDGYESLVASVDEAIGLDSNFIVAFYLFDRLYRTSEHGSREEVRIQGMIEELLVENDQLKPLSTDFYQHLGYRKRVEGDPEGVYEMLSYALELARESDSQYREAIILRLMAEIDGQWRTNPDSHEKSRESLTKAKQMSEALNDRYNIAQVLQTISIYSGTRGEHEEALQCQLEALRMKESLGVDISIDAYNLSRMYCGSDGHTALEWAKIALEGDTGMFGHIAMAHAYMALNRMQEAQQYIDSARKLAFKAGLEMGLGVWYATNARFERQRGDLESALDNLEKSLDINERTNRLNRFRGNLRNLTSMELEMFSPTKENRNDEYSGKWMKRFDDEIKDYDLPGHQAHLLLMKAELRMKQGRHEEGEDLLESVLELTTSPVTKDIHKQAIEIRDKWISEGILLPRGSRESRDR